jgi:2,3-bisphosphoglycerate-independent phosphoglycerate mutase
VGRYYAMDRDKRWERTRRAYDAMVHGSGEATSQSPCEAIQASYAAGITDEFIKAVVVVDAERQPIAKIEDGDSVICFNFRADRMRQIVRALGLDDFEGFDRTPRPHLVVTTMTVYDRTFPFPVAFEPQSLKMNFADVLEHHARANLRLAETEKYAHVTYFFNCGREEPYRGEDRILVPSQKVATYDLMPEMSAPGITEQLVADIEGRKHPVVICNFANADMVGHTGNLDATIAAIETIDGCLGRILTALHSVDGTALVTADHGNAEQMWNTELNAPHTAHTSNPVPVILCADRFVGHTLDDGSLRDVAPTLLELLEIPAPSEMTGRSLL